MGVSSSRNTLPRVDGGGGPGAGGADGRGHVRTLRPSTRRYTRDDIGGTLTLLRQCTVDEWRDHCVAEDCGFSETILQCPGSLHKDCSSAFCMSRNGSLRDEPDSKRLSFYIKGKPSEHFQYNHVPAQLASTQRISVKSVIAYRNSLVILHLVKAKAKARPSLSLFCLIDLRYKRKKFRGTFGELEYEVHREELHCEISPDVGKMALLVPERYHHGGSGALLLIYSTDTLTQITSVQLPTHIIKFTFDPRFRFNRLAITSLTNNNNSVTSISLIENITEPLIITTHNLLEDARSSIRQFRQPYLGHVSYTKDGSLVLATLLDVRCLCGRTQRYTPCQLFMLNGETLQTLHVIAYEHSLCAFHICSVNYIPILSQCGSKMALVGCEVNRYGRAAHDHLTTQPHGAGTPGSTHGYTGTTTAATNVAAHNVVHSATASGSRYVSVYQLPISRTLQNLCRIQIIQVVELQHHRDVTPGIQELPLPSRLKDFLMFKPDYS